MPYKLISLAFLLFFLIINGVNSENEFLLPVEKPSIFKKIDNKNTYSSNNNLPQPKPGFKSEITNKQVTKEYKEQKKLIKPKTIKKSKKNRDNKK